MLDVRKLFLEFFGANQHTILKSAPLIPEHDPTLFFINAGMAPLKEYFLGTKTPPSPNLASCQKCIRAGGKHNDLDEVGYTKRHHTFFEMCGNFSFGGYENSRAIELAWEFLTDRLGLDKNRLYATIHPEDKTSYSIWQELIPKEKIYFLEENQWSMGTDGPCGMCTEIFYDHGPHLSGDIVSGDRFVEVWNIVIMSHQVSNGVKFKLDQICIDTGMGLERINAIISGQDDNFMAPLFKNLLDQIVDITGAPVGPDHKIIADHARAVSFAIADGILPETSGRGYVIRKILRRALSRAANYPQDQQNGLVALAAEYMIQNMSHAYPELAERKELILDTINAEKTQLSEVLRDGKKHIARLTEGCTDTVPGEVLFKLHDTYGLSVDIVSEILESMRLIPDLSGFEELRANKEKGAKQKQILCCNAATQFCGYTQLECEATVVDHGQVEDKTFIVLDNTVLFAEEGGQEYDTGTISGSSWTVNVTEVRKQGNTVVHLGDLIAGKINKEDKCKVQVNQSRRKKLAQHHSATHLLLAALRKYVGEEVMQKGSLVKEDGLRFDFLCKAPLDQALLNNIEKQINQWIQDNAQSSVQFLSQEEAKKAGAIATFGEKYGETVRVVSMGASSELCCGTHVTATGDIGSFYILKEKSIAANVRRIEAVAGEAAYNYAKDRINLTNKLSASLKVTPDSIEDALVKLRSTKNSPSKSDAKLLHGSVAVVAVLEEAPQGQVLSLSDDLLKEHKVVLVLNKFADKSGVVLRSALPDKPAPAILAKLMEKYGGRSGGARADFAQGGANQVLDEVILLQELEELVSHM